MGCRLKTVRTAKGMTQKELAEKSDVNIRMIQDYEQGAKNINHGWTETVLKLADALGCDIRDIIE